MSTKVPKEDLAKAVAALQDIAKGHSSRGTNTTEVASMRDASVGAGSDAGSTQVHHTADNSDRAGWAGSTWDGVSDNGPGVDSVSENGTDYSPQGKVMKSIMDKISKGETLSANETAILKSVVAKSKDKDDDDKDMDKGLPPELKDKFKKDDDDKDMDKSLSDFASEDDSVSKGLEVSEFLAGFAGVMAKSLDAMEARIVSRLLGAQASEAGSNGEFQKSLATAMVNLGQAVSAVAQRQEQIDSAPARGPRAAQNVQAIEKGSYGGPQHAEPMSKALVENTLVGLATSGQCSAQEVIKYNTTGMLSADLEQKVRTAVGR